MCGETEIEAGSLRIRMHQLQALDFGGTLSGYQQQHQVPCVCIHDAVLMITTKLEEIYGGGGGGESVWLSGCDVAVHTMCFRMLWEYWPRSP